MAVQATEQISYPVKENTSQNPLKVREEMKEKAATGNLNDL
ncbi:MAG: hypothetical protein SPL42_00835 [Bacteroidales bacterium]|nr:hypothetical protein [Bacteroidales bacterium]MDY6346964.1 hypothetical protein [Bacteroidales bacterium]